MEDAIGGVLAGHPEVVGAYLFGSRARGDAHAASDVDVAIVFDRPQDLERTVGLEGQLEDALGMRVDVVDLLRADAFLALDAIRGERIFARDGRRLDETDLFILRRAGDLAHFERERRRARLAAPRA